MKTSENFPNFVIQSAAKGSLTKPAEASPILCQLVRQVLSPSVTKTASSERSDGAADIEYHSSGMLKDLLKTSFSYFMGSTAAKPKPSDAAGERIGTTSLQ